MNILVLTDLYPPYYLGGYELKCKLHVDELKRRGHTVTVLTSRWKSANSTSEVGIDRALFYDHLYLDIQFKEPYHEDWLRLQRRYYQIKWAIECRRNFGLTRNVAMQVKPDVVFVWHLAHVSIHPLLATQDLGIPTVFHIDDYWLMDLKSYLEREPNPFKRLFHILLMGVPNLRQVRYGEVLVVSREVKRQYMNVGFPEETMQVIPQGVPENIILKSQDLSNMPRTQDQVRLVYAGRLDPLKGVHVAIEAVSFLRKELNIPDVHLDIIGTGPKKYLDELHLAVSEEGLNEHVSFVGVLPHTEVLERLATYSAALIPSLWPEPLSGMIAEAMARGLPVISTNCGGAPEIIKDGENGLLVPPGDAPSLARAVECLHRQLDLEQQIRQRGLLTVMKDYNHERIMDQVENCLVMAQQKVESSSP